MKIVLTRDFKSLKPFSSEELNDLTIITGKNGCGKSQLITLIEEISRTSSSTSGAALSIVPWTNKIQVEGIVKRGNVQVPHFEWRNKATEYFLSYAQMGSLHKSLLAFIVENDLIHALLDAKRTSVLSKDPEYLYIIKQLVTQYPRDYGDIHNREEYIEDNLDIENRYISFVKEPHIVNLMKVINETIKFTGKKVNEITERDMYAAPLSNMCLEEQDLFKSNVEYIFYSYARRRNINRNAFFYRVNDGAINNSISDDEFIENDPPPWESINKIFERHNIDFYFKGVPKEEFSLDYEVSFPLYKRDTNDPIEFESLSAGERVIIGLILKLFTTEHYGDSLSFPEIIVLDEPDAHLHPEMSKLLLEVLSETFVTKYGVKVLMTTHSPSTIALASEGQIYQLTNGAGSSLTKISRDQALKLLTGLIPTLSIDYRNHRQIFVESPTDLYYYQSIYDKLQRDQKFDFKLYFLSNGFGNGSCEQVIKVVDDIRMSENTTFFGVIDWDGKDHSRPDHILVHGVSNRYSIENYLFDPAYLCTYFLKQNAFNLRQILQVDETYNEYHLVDDVEKLKVALNWFFSFIYKKKPYYRSLADVKAVGYFNGTELEIPAWYLTEEGHLLEDFVISVFPALHKYQREKTKFKEELTNIVLKVYPFIPTDTVALIRSLATQSS